MTRTLLTILCIVYPLITNAGKPVGSSDNFIYKTDLNNLLQTAEDDEEIKDFGDAPIIYGSADHIIDSKNYLGSIVDKEAAYQASEEADADDLNGQDDEDGVVFPEIIQGTKAILKVKIVGLAYLNVWIDWNGDGDFLDNNEYIFKNSLRMTGTYNLTVSVPENAIISKATFARFRFGPSTSITPAYNSSGSAKYGEVEDYMIKIQCVAPLPPRVGTITQPTCEVPEGSVILTGLPATGTWILTRLPDGTTTTGKGTSTTISGLESGTFQYTVTNEKGCSSSPSGDIVINPRPVNPGTPLIGTITQPSCTVSTGTIVLNGLPETGTWNLIRYPDKVELTGTGKSTTITGLKNGTYYFEVTNSDGCTSSPSSDVVISVQPSTPTAPVVKSITQPTCSVSSGTVELTGLPSSGNWILIRYPDMTETTGTGTSIIISGLDPGTYNYTVTNAEGCSSSPSAGIIIQASATTPSAPVIETITQPTCNVSSGTVVLTGLPATGIWKLTRYPGEIIITGTGVRKTISLLPEGTFNFTVTNAEGCTSTRSSDVVIDSQPPTPTVPVVEKINQPTCNVPTGSVILNGLPSSGTWTLTRFPGTIKTTGTGNSTTISGLGPGTYNFTVTNSQGCTSMASVNIIINVQPVSPSAPVIGAITQPTCIIPTGTVVLKGLPASGTWTLTRYPDKVIVTGSGTTKTITDLTEGKYNFTLTNSAGCTSIPSSDVVIDPQPVTTPVIKITNPAPLCFPETANLTAPSITDGSTAGLTFTYWKDSKASIPYNTPTQATAGTYYIKGTTSLGCYGIQPVTVTSFQQPVAHAGPDQILKYQFTATLDADYPGENLTGSWSIIAGSGQFSDASDAKSTISELAIGKNILLWSVTNGVCPAAEDYVALTVQDLLIPTLITPDMNGKNDFFILEGLESLGKTSLIIFDRRGMKVFSSENYDNLWHGVDYNGYPLPNDTYFYVVRSETGLSLNGFIVIRR